MKQLKCRLIVSDFDGTLINDNQQIPDKVKASINEYVNNGGIFAVCTGRMLCCILPQVRELGLKGLVIAYQGTQIAEIESGKIIKNGGMDYKDVADICRVLEELEQPINIYAGNALYTNIPKDNKYLLEYERIVGIDSEYVPEKLSQFVSDKKLFCQKVAILVHAHEQKQLYEKIHIRLGKKFDVTCSAKVLIEISPLTDNKGEAVRFLANYYNIPLTSCVAVGDNLNDLSMIQTAGIGVAVENAVQELKDAANFISVSNNQGALAQIIEKFGFA